MRRPGRAVRPRRLLAASLLCALSAVAAPVAIAIEPPVAAPRVIERLPLIEPFDPYLTTVPSSPFAIPEMPAGMTVPLHTQHGVVAPDAVTSRAFAPRLGLRGITGTHTEGLMTELGVAWSHSARYGALTADVSETLGAFGQQWSYEFAGVESQSTAELVWTFDEIVPLIGGLGLGWRGDWFFNRSFEEIRGGAVAPEDEHRHLEQRLGTIILHLDSRTPVGFRRWRIEYQNDVAQTGGDGGDKFRTAYVRLLLMNQVDEWQTRYGINLDLFTGATVRGMTTPDGRFYDQTGLPFADRSQGLIELEFGVSRFHQLGRYRGELGFDLELGPDSEQIRDFIQNQFIHKQVTGSPFVAKVDRSNRFKVDVSVYYTVHF